MKTVIRRILKITLIALLAGALALSGARLFTVLKAYGGLRQKEEITETAKAGYLYDAILVLGAAVYRDRTPSPVLESRLELAADLFQSGAAPKIIVSGDHDPGNYDEVDVMADWLVKHGVSRHAIVTDYRGFSTYDSVVRVVKEGRFGRILIVTQRYHLYRADVIAEAYGLEADGVAAENKGSLWSRANRVAREWLATVKDLWNCMIKKEIPE